MFIITMVIILLPHCQNHHHLHPKVADMIRNQRTPTPSHNCTCASWQVSHGLGRFGQSAECAHGNFRQGSGVTGQDTSTQPQHQGQFYLFATCRVCYEDDSKNHLSTQDAHPNPQYVCFLLCLFPFCFSFLQVVPASYVVGLPLMPSFYGPWRPVVMQHCIEGVLDGAGFFGTLAVAKTGGWDGKMLLGIYLWILWMEAE